MSVSSKSRIAIVGGGKMGEAILGGWLAANEGAAANLAVDSMVVINPGESRRAALSERYGVACVPTVLDLGSAEAFDLVVLAVKPQIMADVLADLRCVRAFCEGALFVSIAAGLTTQRLEGMLPEGARLVRVMPNMPLAIGQGASAVTSGSNASKSDVELVAELFGCLGDSVIVEEGLMDACCAVSGSGPAYVAAMIEALRDAGVAEGLPVQIAEALALQTVLGTSQLISQTGQSPAAVRESICSPGGTTLAALAAMREAGFDQVFAAGVSAAVRRSKELAQC